MNQVFDLKRFTLLLAKHWNENRKRYMLGFLAMAGLMLFWYTFILITNRGSGIPANLQSMTYFVGLVITGCYFGSVLFSDLSSGPKAMTYLSLPASHLEKLLCGLFYGVFIFFLAYTVIFYIVDIPMVKIGNSLSGQPGMSLGNQPFKEHRIVNVFSNPAPDQAGSNGADENPFVLFMLLYLAIQAAYILGSVYFSKFSFIKTTIALAALGLLVVAFIGKVLYPDLPPHSSWLGLTSWQVYSDGESVVRKTVSLGDGIENTLRIIIKFAFAPLLWVVTYFRFKEKEV
jgi:hypothetical protein